MKPLFSRVKTTLIFLLLCASLPLSAQDGTRGKDFWLTFGRNEVSTDFPNADINLQIRIVGSELATTGNIYFTNLGTSVPFSIAAGQVYTHHLSAAEKQAASCNKSQGISNLSVRITTSEPVTVYALNQSYRTTDASNVLPTAVLGTDYYQISYTAISGYGDAYAVIAAQDSTQIHHNGTLTATLNTGEIYYRTNYSDMTGSYITADKPAAFFALHQGPQIPSGTPFVDILFQQLAPISTWGKTFFAPVSWRGKDFIRIVASQNGTNVSQVGGTIRNVSGGQTTLTNLNAGQWVELEILLANNGCYIQSDKPVGVCTYLTGTRYNHPTDELSDPAQAWLPAIEQKINTGLIAPFFPTVLTNLKEHYALIITATATKDSTIVKIGTGAEQPLSSGTWYDNAAAGMSFYSYPLIDSTSAYLFTNRVGGLIIMGYGTGIAESYYYLASSRMRVLDASFFVNDIHYQNISSERICTQPVQFRSEIRGDISTAPGYLKWYIDGVEETSARDQFTWNKTLPKGKYQIKMEAIMEDNILKETREGTLIIDSVEIVNTSGETTICVGNTVFLNGTPLGGEWKSVNHSTATVYSYGTVTGISAGTAEIRYIYNSIGCKDSATATIKITLPTVEAATTPEICSRENATIALTVNNSEAPNTIKYNWDGRTEETSSLSNIKAGTYKATISDSFCTVEKTVIVEHVDAPIADFEFPTNVVKGQTFFITDLSKGTVQTWNWDMGDSNTQTGKSISHIYPKEGDYCIFLKVIDINNCTDVVSKMIHIYDELRIYIPNTFTPNGDGINDTWKPIMLDYSTKGYQLSIFDRWGQRIFHTTNTEESWDGTIDGNAAAPNTVYSYQVTVKDISEKEFKFSGSVRLVR